MVKFCVALKKSPTETIKTIESVGKYKQCSPATVYKWHARFRSGRDSVKDDPRCGRPAVVMCSVKEPVKDIINRDKRTTVREIADKLDISVSTVHGILREELDMSKVSARWVPRLLQDSERKMSGAMFRGVSYPLRRLGRCIFRQVHNHGRDLA